MAAGRHRGDVSADAAYPLIALAAHHWGGTGVSSGVDAYARTLVPAMAQLGRAPYVVANQPGEGSGHERVRAVPSWDAIGGRGVRRLVGIAGRRLALDHTAIWMMSLRLLSVLRRLQAEAGVESFETEESCGVAGLLARRSPVPVVLRLHGPWFLVGPAAGAARDRSFRWRVNRERVALLRAAGVSAPSSDVLARTEAHYGRPLPLATVIPNPVTPVPKPMRWSVHTCRPGQILFVGRFDRAKGADVLLDAFLRVLRTEPTAKLVMVGGDAGLCTPVGGLMHAEAYIDRVIPRELADRVVWLGPRSPEELPELRRQSNVCVTSSRYESFSLVTLEAMASGCPVVAPAVGGIPEIVRHEHNGLLYRRGDAAEMARHVVRILRDRQLARTLGEQALVDSEREYSPAVIARQTLEFHAEVIGRSLRSREGKRI